MTVGPCSDSFHSSGITPSRASRLCGHCIASAACPNDPPRRLVHGYERCAQLARDWDRFYA